MTDDTDGDESGDVTEAGDECSSPRADLDVPAAPPDPESDEHVLAPDELVYPTFDFESGDATWVDGFDLDRSIDEEVCVEWLESLAGSIRSHDLAVTGSNTRVTFGVRPDQVRFAYDPETDRRGTLTVTVSLDGYVVRSEDADRRPTGARGGRGFVPLELLTGDREPSEFRCYNWVDEPGTDTPGPDDDGD